MDTGAGSRKGGFEQWLGGMFAFSKLHFFAIRCVRNNTPGKLCASYYSCDLNTTHVDSYFVLICDNICILRVAYGIERCL
jgi:hypothetical protein